MQWWSSRVGQWKIHFGNLSVKLNQLHNYEKRVNLSCQPKFQFTWKKNFFFEKCQLLCIFYFGLVTIMTCSMRDDKITLKNWTYNFFLITLSHLTQSVVKIKSATIKMNCYRNWLLQVLSKNLFLYTLVLAKWSQHFKLGDDNDSA